MILGIIDLAHRFFRPNKAAVPDDTRIYVIGDVHGRYDLLQELQEKIRHDIDQDRTVSNIKQVFLGDYIDRGTQSKDVINFFLEQQQDSAIEQICLKGNHEAIFIKFLCDPSVLSSWQNFGGLDTLSSYGVDLGCLQESGGFEIARQSLVDLIPKTHLEFYHSLKPSYEIGDYFFCHAGVRPGVSLENQQEEDLIWIREEFLESSSDYGKMIVHGHTPVEQPELWKNRINIDTGAYMSNKLTCLVLEGKEKRCL